jgi:hypothetical protein
MFTKYSCIYKWQLGIRLEGMSRKQDKTQNGQLTQPRIKPCTFRIEIGRVTVLSYLFDSVAGLI